MALFAEISGALRAYSQVSQVSKNLSFYPRETKRRTIIQAAFYFIRISRNMSSHLERTSDIKRSKCISEATVTEIKDISPTVKALRLQVQNSQFSFMAGQWVDFIIPKHDIVGGFSMYSSPKLLEDSRKLDLAVKFSTHRPANWVHTQCSVGDMVILKAGGECVWNPKDAAQRKHTLLLAGGIGINPIFSILQNIEDTRKFDSSVGKSILLYSASTKDELIFKDEIDLLCSESKMLTCKFYVTQELATRDITIGITGGRINDTGITDALKLLSADEKGLQCFICGPPPMIKNLIEILNKHGVNNTDIHYEQWW